MIWDFQDATKFESAYGVHDHHFDSVEEIVKAIASELSTVEVLPRDPVADYERMYREAAINLKGTERARAAFLHSALERVKKMGNGVLLSISKEGCEFRIVVTCVSVSVLQPTGCEERFSEAIARTIANRLGGTARELVD